MRERLTRGSCRFYSRCSVYVLGLIRGRDIFPHVQPLSGLFQVNLKCHFADI